MVYSCPRIVAAHTPFDVHEVRVKDGLSYTPAEMNDLTAKGRSVSLETLSGLSYFEAVDGDTLPIHMQRGVDLNDAFEAQYDSHEKMSKFKHSLKQVDANVNDIK